MSDVREETFLFDCAGARLVGIVATPLRVADESLPSAGLGVLVVVGGPQYRVGSHRQFVLLSRALAGHGFPVMRFDCAGMGDSDGAARAFTDRDDEIRAAIDAFIAHAPTVTDIVIWGLCDAASAALLYAHRDVRVRQLVLLNPWVRSDAGLARTQLKHYYTHRFLERRFWRDLVAGRIGVLRAIRGLFATVATARAVDRGSETTADFRVRMARGWRAFQGDILLIASGDDLTAREFVDHAGRDAAWNGLVDGSRVVRCDIPDADHTFSRALWRDLVAERTAEWLAGRCDGRSTPPHRPAERADSTGRTRMTA